MKLLLTLISLVILLANCIDVKVESIKLDSLETTEEPPPPPPPMDPAKLQGAWTDGSTENATFFISKGDIKYIDQLQSFPYSLSSDSIEIMYDDHTYKAHISLLNDTLSMRDEDGETRFWRFRN